MKHYVSYTDVKIIDLLIKLLKFKENIKFCFIGIGFWMN